MSLTGSIKYWLQKPHREQWLPGFSGVPVSVNNKLIFHFKKGLTLSPGRVTVCYRTGVWSILTQRRANKGRNYNGILQIAVIHLPSCCFSWILLDLRRTKASRCIPWVLPCSCFHPFASVLDSRNESVTCHLDQGPAKVTCSMNWSLHCVVYFFLI